MSRVLVTGATGMLGTDLCVALSQHEVTALSRVELDVCDPDAVAAAVSGHHVVINAAAYTKVDDAETHEDEAYRVNALGAENIARAAATCGARMIHVSTDYVFDGRATSPYAEDAPRNPISAYGRTKAAGEERVLAAHPLGTAIVRTAWLHGAHGPNFVDTIRRLATERETLSVVDDQQGQPTWSRDVAHRLVELVDLGVPAGIFHATNSGQTTWWGLARAIFELTGLDPQRVEATDSSNFVRPAPRPAYSVLGHDGWSRIGLAPMRSWFDALSERLMT